MFKTKREEQEFLANFERDSKRDWEKLQDDIHEWLGETRKTLGQYVYGGGDDENWMDDEDPFLDDWDDDEDDNLQDAENEEM